MTREQWCIIHQILPGEKQSPAKIAVTSSSFQVFCIRGLFLFDKQREAVSVSSLITITATPFAPLNGTDWFASPTRTVLLLYAIFNFEAE